MPAPVNEEQAAKASLSAVQLMASLQQRVDDLTREVVALKATVKTAAADVLQWISSAGNIRR